MASARSALLSLLLLFDVEYVFTNVLMGRCLFFYPYSSCDTERREDGDGVHAFRFRVRVYHGNRVNGALHRGFLSTCLLST
jgi:hypothetical protein